MPAADEIKHLKARSVTEEEFATQTSQNVRYSSTIVHPTEPTTVDQMNVVEASGTLDFWNDPEEDVYSETDGDAV